MLMIFEVSQRLAAKVRFRHAHHIRSKRTTRFVDANGTQLLIEFAASPKFPLNKSPSYPPFAAWFLNVATLLITVFSSLFYVASSPLLQSGALWQTLDQLLQKWIAIQLRHRPSKCYLEGFCCRSWTFWRVLSSLFLWKKHRKSSCCFFCTLAEHDDTLKQFDHLFHTRNWHLRISVEDSMNFGSAWYFSSAAADSRATRNTLVFQWKPRWERKLGSIKHWFRSFHVTIMIAYVHSTIFSIACSASPSDRKFRAMVLPWSSEQCISNQAKTCMELASG